MNGLLLNVICAFTIANANPNIERAQQTLDALYWRALEIRNIKSFWKTKYYQDWKNISTHEENHSLTHLISAVNLSPIVFMMTTSG